MLKNVNRDALESLVIRVPVILFSFLYSIFIIRMLGPEGNGLYAFMMAGVSLSIVAAGFDAKRSTLFHLAKSQFESRKVLGFAIKVHIASIVFVLLVLVFAYLFRTRFTYLLIPEEYFTIFYMVFFFLSFVFQHLTALCQTILQSIKAFRSINKFLLISNLIQVVLFGLGYLYVETRQDSISFLTGFSLILIAQAVTFMLSFYYTIKKYQGGLAFDANDVKKPFLEYARLGYVNQIGHFLNKRLDVWFVEIFSGLTNLGLYALASQLTNFLLLAAAPIEEVLKPYLITLDRKQGNVMFLRYFKLILYFILFLAFILYWVAPWIVTVLFGEEFIGAISALRILCLGVVLVNVKRVLLNYNRSYNDLNYNIWAQWFGVLCTIIFGLLLIPKFGIIGAAWTSVIAYGSAAIILATIFLIKQQISIWKLFIPTSSEIADFKT
ncbi:oligosaccharide flippase family protein [Portibacter marinus]|uniref:oligosaccharide flippase family protein n=1 Tax=Portibacter marinus TaxID=2898660 RepID=UPI001F3408C3|nr:oligosaccharide flippase family protein [Portibacter marinus]